MKCSSATGDGVAVRMRNQLDGPVSVYELPPGVIDANQCELVLVTLIAAGTTREFARPGGTVLRVVDDRSGAAVRLVRLPSAATACTLTVPAR